MKKSTKRFLCGALSLALVSTFIVEHALGVGHAEEGVERVSKVASFEDVTGKFDTSALRAENLNGSVMQAEDVAPTYETRTVILSLDKNNLIDEALKANKDVSSYIDSFSGKTASARIRDQQDALLSRISQKGISYKLERRYSTVLNGVAIEVNTKYVKTLKAMAGVESVVIANSYTQPETITTSATASDITNETSVYRTGIYDTANYTDVNGSAGDLGEGTVVAILDTGLDYTHPAFARIPQNYAWDKAEVEGKLKNKDLTAETHGSLDVNDVFVSEKVPFAFDYADKDSNVYPSYSNHGTHVAGIIGGYDASGYTDKDGYPVTDVAFRGVVPDAQLVICKVFTDDLDDKDLGGAEAEDIIAALNDCVALGVDVINMSLGTSCGFSTTDDGDDEGELLNQVYEDIKSAGISLVCAASNDFSSGYGGVYGTNLITNPDSSTVGSPSTFASALSVASISGQKAKYMVAKTEDGEEIPAFYEESRDKNSNPFDFAQQLLGDNTKGEFTYVVVPNRGRAQDYTAQTKRLLQKDGFQIALVKRGDNSFQDKVEVATANGAEAIIVYNNVAGIIRMNLGDIENPIPSASIDMDAGLALVELAGGVNKTYTITVDKSLEAGPFMSDFSSWGPTHDLKLKPEITAHGGEITSTVPGGYGEQSGTSMASPNMAGVMAIIRNYIKANPDKFGAGLTAVQINRLANQLIMSTATTVRDTAGRVYSPRKQGAGLGSLDNVLTKTGAYLSVDNASNDYRPKIELGDGYVDGSAYEMSFQITNFSDAELTFTPELICVTETISKDGLAVAEQARTLTTTGAGGSLAWSGNAVNDDGKVVVGAGEIKTVSVRFVLDQASIDILNEFPNGMYVEGFLRLKSDADTQAHQCDLSLPYLAFYGDWEGAPMLDYTAYEVAESEADSSVLEEDKLKASVWATQPFATYYNEKYIIPMGGYVYLLDEDDEKMYAKEEYCAVSRYNDYYADDEARSYMTTTAVKAVYAGLFRNARVVKYMLTDVRTGEVILTDSCNRVGKAYAGGGSGVPANVEVNLSPEQEALVANGEYRLDFVFYMNDPETYTNFDAPNADNAMEEYSFTFTVDYDAPILEDVRIRYYDYKEGTKEKQRIYLDIDVFDNHYPQAMMLCYPTENAEGETVLKLCTEYPTPVRDAKKNTTNTVSIEITDFYEEYGQQLYVQIDDYALNSCLYQINITSAQAGPLPEKGAFDLAEGEEQITLGIYETHKVKLNYAGDANLSNFGWRAVNPTVADVRNGEIVGLKAGETVIYVHDHQMNQKQIKVTVKDEVVGKLAGVPGLNFNVIETDKEWLAKASGFVSVAPGKQFSLQVSPDPWYHPMSDLSFVWASSNPSVATVDQNGQVNTLREGTASISAQVWRNGKQTQYKCIVTLQVVDEFDASNYTLQSYNGIGYNGEICPTCGRSWEYEELLSDLYCPHCKTTEIKENDGQGVTLLKIPTKLNAMYIGEDVFKDNDNIERIVIPSTVVNINESAFEKCTALKEVYFVSTLHRDVNGDGVPENADIDYSDLSLIHKRAFYGCSALEKVDFSNVKTITIANECFADCVRLTQIVDMPSVGTAHHYAFKNCVSLGKTGALDLSGLFITGNNVFEGCTGISAIQTGKFTSVGNYMFKDCTGLKEKITLSSAIVGNGAFAGCVNLKGVAFSSDAQLEIEIGANAFEKCGANLADGNFTVEFGDEILRVLGSNAFKNSSLKNFAFTEGLVSLGANAFAGTQLTTLTVDALNAGDLMVLGVPFANVTLNVSTGSTRYIQKDGVIYEKLDGSSVRVAFTNALTGDVVIPQTVNGYEVVAIGAYAFANSNATSLTAPSVEVLGVGAFENSQLQTISLGAVKEIPARAFYGSAITAIEMSSVTQVGDYAFANSALNTFKFINATTFGDEVFANCLALETVSEDAFTTKENVVMGDYLFVGSINLTTAHVPAVSELGMGAFMGLSALEKVTFANDATTLGSYTFIGSSVEEVVFSNKVKTIGDFAFAYCERLERVDVSAVWQIGASAFRGCRALKTVQATALRNRVDASGEKVLAPAVGAYAFSGCSALNNLTLPVALASDVSGLAGRLILAEGAFEGCRNLQSVDLSLVASVGDLAFMNTGLTSVDLSSVSEVGAGAFAGCKSLTQVVINGNDNYYVENNGVYRYIDKDKKQTAFAFYPAGVVAPKAQDSETRVYKIAEGAVRVDAYAFYGLKNGSVNEVVIPYSVKAIGDSAFQNAGIKTYTFESINAPVLETVYRKEVQDYIESLETALTSANYKGYYYTNFQTNIVDYTKYGTEDSQLILNRPDNGVGYDTHLYKTYFNTVNTTGVYMTDVTRSCKQGITALHDVETVKGWLNLAITDVNKQMVQSFAQAVTELHTQYNQIAIDEKQLALLGEEVAQKLFDVEEQLRQVKKRFNIAVRVQSAECAKTSTHKTQYLVGEKFDMTGLLVTLVYDDFSTETVDASKLTLVKDKPLTKLDSYVEVLYRDGNNEQTAFVMIQVKEQVVEQPETPQAPEEETPTPLGFIIGLVAGVAVAGVAVAVTLILVKKGKKAKSQTSDDAQAENEEK